MVSRVEVNSKFALVEIKEEELDLLKYTQFVSDPGAGAIASFIGTTRNSFNGKKVISLEYEAYTPMANKKIQELCEEAQQKWNLTKIAVAHRIGVVDIEQASVIIVASSPHRKEALEATHWAIDKLKSDIPIWKKEIYEDGSQWKENTEWIGLQNQNT
eukprot:TRINITY_DN28164_c1_g1_i1.p2 TRINITY_DN28164_c1_g1~~TRINITY_DN28164_c1_g1_i1.p2  ORF type:complete len:158 (-),score=18.64 TRINITY_DN28164_c1_g1_i1:276-749(-)